MEAGQRLRDNNNRQVALFPLTGFSISQTDTGTASHGGGAVYWATDYLALDSNGNRIYRATCYAPVDMECTFINQAECMAVWTSIAPVHLANDMIDYLTITCYHDNDIENGTYPFMVGSQVRQGEYFFKTGTGGVATGDHLHLETGYGHYTTNISGASGTPEYKFHITDYTNPKRLHNYNALFINNTNPIDSPTPYVWITYNGPITSLRKNKFKFVLYANKIRNKKIT